MTAKAESRRIINDRTAQAEELLAEIEGIGAKKRMALLEKFGTIDKIMNANVEELASAEGIGAELAERIYRYFREEL